MMMLVGGGGRGRVPMARRSWTTADADRIREMAAQRIDGIKSVRRSVFLAPPQETLELAME